jgi:outer membrane protein
MTIRAQAFNFSVSIDGCQRLFRGLYHSSSRKLLAQSALVAGLLCISHTLPAATSDSAAEDPPVSGRMAIGAMVGPRYSGGAGTSAFPVPLASLRFGDYAYIDYWQAGLYLLGNQEKTLGLAVIGTPRLGFSARDGQNLSGMKRRKTSVESGLSIDYGSDTGGVSLGYLHDLAEASRGEVVRLLLFRQIEISDKFAFDAYVNVERLNSRIARYYYGVANDEATLARPSYQPGPGIDLNFGLHFNYDFGEKSTILFGCDLTRLGNFTVSSPIVERRIDRFFYFGYGWRL